MAPFKVCPTPPSFPPSFPPSLDGVSSFSPSLPPTLVLASFLPSYGHSLTSPPPSLPPSPVKARNVVSYRNTTMPTSKVLQSTVSVQVDAQVRKQALAPSPPRLLPPSAPLIPPPSGTSFVFGSFFITFFRYYFPPLHCRVSSRSDRTCLSDPPPPLPPSRPPALPPSLRSPGET